MKDDPHGFAHYMQKLPPTVLQQLFKESIDEDILQRFFVAIDQYYFPQDADGAYHALKALSKSKRFDVFLLGLCDPLKSLLLSIINKMENPPAVEGDDGPVSLSQDLDIERLKEIYKLV